MYPSAIIFDLDGVLVCTDILHKNALLQAINDTTGIDAAGEFSAKSMLSTKQKLKLVQQKYEFCAKTYDTILAKKDTLFVESVSTLQPSANVVEALHYVKSHDIPTAVASNSRRASIHQVLSATKLLPFFDTLVSAEDVPLPKPAPDILFEVYKRLGLSVKEQHNTLFIEDSEEGARAGYASHSTVIKIDNPGDLTIGLIKKWITPRSLIAV